MQTITLDADFPAKGQTTMAGRKLVHGQERKRLVNFLRTFNQIEARDGKVKVVNDLGDFKGQLVFDTETDPTMADAVAKVKDRVIELLEKEV